MFVNCKLKDEDGTVLGVIGVGLETPYIQKLLGDNEQQYQIAAYLVDGSGKVQLSSTLTEFEQVNLFDNPIYSEIKQAIINNKTTTENKWYASEQDHGYFVTRYIPYLNWYLIVEKSTDALHQKIAHQLQISGALGLVVLSCVLGVTTVILKKNNRQITLLAEQDQLTGCKNRTGYERDIAHYQGQIENYPLFGIGILDLNALKAVNNLFGHQEGDAYLQILPRY